MPRRGLGAAPHRRAGRRPAASRAVSQAAVRDLVVLVVLVVRVVLVVLRFGIAANHNVASMDRASRRAPSQVPGLQSDGSTTGGSHTHTRWRDRTRNVMPCTGHVHQQMVRGPNRRATTPPRSAFATVRQNREGRVRPPGAAASRLRLPASTPAGGAEGLLVAVGNGGIPLAPSRLDTSRRGRGAARRRRERRHPACAFPPRHQPAGQRGCSSPSGTAASRLRLPASTPAGGAEGLLVAVGNGGIPLCASPPRHGSATDGPPACSRARAPTARSPRRRFEVQYRLGVLYRGAVPEYRVERGQPDGLGAGRRRSLTRGGSGILQGSNR